MVLILFHGNAAVESGFSVNKELFVENMEEDTIVTQRVVFDAIRVAGMVCHKRGHIKQDDCVRQSHSVYHSAQQLKKEKQSAEEKHAREDRKERRRLLVFSSRKSKS